MPVLGRYWVDAANIGPVPAQYWYIMAFLWGLHIWVSDIFVLPPDDLWLGHVGFMLLFGSTFVLVPYCLFCPRTWILNNQIKSNWFISDRHRHIYTLLHSNIMKHFNTKDSYHGPAILSTHSYLLGGAACTTHLNTRLGHVIL